MIIAMCSIGDELVTLTRVVPLVKDAADTYNLSFTDLPTDRTYTHSYTGENDAVTAFAAWLCADQEVLGPELDAARAELRNSPAHKFMP